MSKPEGLDVSVPDALRCHRVPHLPDDGSGWAKVRCPFHNGGDDLFTSSACVNTTTGVFSCFKCPNSALPFWGWLSKILPGKLSPADVERRTRAALGIAKDIPPDYVETCALALNRPPNGAGDMAHIVLRGRLMKKGISALTISTFKLGADFGDHGAPRVTIPVYDNDGMLLNVRRYLPGGDAGSKYMNLKNCGAPQLYPSTPEVLTAQKLVITEGELKALALIERGIPARSPTAGASKWDVRWNSQFAGKDIGICFDVNDRDREGKFTDVGQKGARHIAYLLSSVAASVRIIVLPLPESYKGGDVNNFFADEGKSAQDFMDLWDATPLYQAPAAPTDRPDDLTEHATPLASAADASLLNKHVVTDVIVSAKDPSPYIVPVKVSVQCKRGEMEYCHRCPVATAEGGVSLCLQRSDPRLLELIDVGESEQATVWKQVGGIVPKCTMANFQTEESVNLEAIRAIPQLSLGHNTDESVVRKIFYTGRGLEANCGYQLKSRATVMPLSQHATLLAYSAEPLRDSLRDFTLSQDLRVFQPSEWTVAAIQVKLADLYEDLCHNVTRVYQRDSVHLFCDLVWHSVLRFHFQGTLNLKGWVDALLLGDSGQGKSTVVDKLREHYGCGERIDSKRASAAGLLGGVDKDGNRNFLVWGAIPLNDGRMCILEELKGMAVEALAVLTDMRSSGVAEVRKITGGKTNARTRLLSVSNPRSTRKLSEYAHGISAVQELMGSQEDVRRLDMAMGVCGGEVPDTVINRGSSLVVPHYATRDLCSHLVSWAWSRQADEVVWAPGAEEAVVVAALRMGRAYSSAIPLVEIADQRLKLARLSCAMAARTFSTDDGIRLVVRPCHVEVVEAFLHQIYTAPALNYGAFSKMHLADEQNIDEPSLTRVLQGYGNCGALIETLLEAPSIREQDFMNVSEMPREEANLAIGMLVRCGALRRKKDFYERSSGFTRLLKRLSTEKLQNLTRAEIISAKSEV